MDRKYLEEHLSAYLDGELPPEKMTAFAAALKAHPNLQAELAELAALDKFAQQRQVELPSEGYFEGLAERIESRIEREIPKQRGRIIEFVLAYRRPVAVISSIAAVLMVALVAINYTGKHGLENSRTIIIKDTTVANPAAMPTTTPKSPDVLEAQPVPQLEEVGGDALLKRKAAPATKPEPRQPKESSVTTETARPTLEVIPGVVKSDSEGGAGARSLNKEDVSAKGDQLIITPSSLSDTQQTKPFRLTEEMVRRTEIGAALLSMESSNREVRWGATSPEEFEARIRQLIDKGDWDEIAQLPRPIDVPIEPESTVAQEPRAKASFAGPHDREREQAERALQNQTRDPFSRIFARLLIEHYLSLDSVPQRSLWESRLDSLRADTLR